MTTTIKQRCRLRVIKRYGENECAVWDNFLEALPHHLSIEEGLEEWNGRNIYNSDYIEFETEQAKTMFLLRWS